jgi:hypothetical protein
MATVAALPPSLREKLTALARRIRLLRAVRGVSFVALVLLLTGSAALLLDAWLELPAVVRGLLLAGWLALGAFATVATVVVPLARSLRSEALAALIETKYPDLGERLTSAVELAGGADSAHGSPALIALLLQETDARTSRLDVFQAFPARFAAVLAGVAGLVTAAALSPALLWPQRYAQLGRRFLAPWEGAARVVPYRLEVAPGDVVAALGRPLTVSVRVLPLDGADPVLPRTATLVYTDAQQRTRRLPMVVERTDAFTFRLDRVAEDFTYAVEAGEAVSDPHAVTAVQPADLDPDRSTVTVTPPAYARDAVRTESAQGVADVTVLQHSRLHFDLAFTRPVVTAVLQWLPPAARENTVPRVIPVTLAADRQGGQVELPAAFGCSFQLVLEVEHGIRTEIGPRVLTVQPDEPPVFVKVTGLPAADAVPGRPAPPREDLRMVLPYDSVPLDVTVADDIGVAQLAVEYRVNDGPPAREAVRLPEANARQVSARHTFQLAERALKEGDVLRYRLRAEDNRNVPEAELGPNVSYHPADRWLTLKVARQAEPLRQQEIVAQRDEINQRLEAIKQDLLKEQRGLYKLREESRSQPALKPGQARALQQLRQENRASENALRELAKEAAETPALQALADRAMNVADQEMQRGDKALQAAQREDRPEPRDERLRATDRELTEALQRLDELRRANEQLAQERADQMRLEMLADRQQRLADQAFDRATHDPVKDAAKPRDAEEMKREQGELAEQLRRLAEQSEPLRKAVEAAKADRAKELAEKARDLAKSQRDLSAESQKGPEKTKLADLARQQQKLAGQAAELARETRQPAQAARTAPLKPEEPRKAAEALEKGDAGEALRHQDEAARDLERLAGDLQRAAEQARDPKEAARQLARVQDGVRQQLEEKVRTQDRKKPLAGQLQEVNEAQEGLRKAVEGLPVPPEQGPAREEQRRAVERAKQAEKALYKPNPREAETAMQEARAALERLADRLPSQEDRRRQAREEVGRLRQQQEEIKRQAEQIIKESKDKPDQLAKRLLDTTRRQAETTTRLGKTDTPEQRAQRDEARQALERAQSSLLGAKPEDIAATQEEARRQLEELEKALANRPAAPEKAGEPAPPQGLPRREQGEQARQLAQEQRRLLEEVRKLTEPTPAEAQQAGRQRQLEKQAGDLMQDVNRLAQQTGRAPQAQQAAQQAENSGRQAQAAMHQADDRQRQGNRGQTEQSRQQAAGSLDKAAEQLDRAAQELARGLSPAQQQTGQSVQQAQGEMGQAQTKLGENQGQAAQAAMQRAAQQLQQAAQQLAQQQQQSQPGTPSLPRQPPRGATGGGAPDLRTFGDDVKQYAGKRWGELPGELRTRIVQDLQARYGEDYARIIKLYFEQIADTKGK